MIPICYFFSGCRGELPPTCYELEHVGRFSRHQRQAHFGQYVSSSLIIAQDIDGMSRFVSVPSSLPQTNMRWTPSRKLDRQLLSILNGGSTLFIRLTLC